MLKKIHSSRSPLHLLLLHITKSVASFSTKYHPCPVHPQNNTRLSRLHPSDATPSVFKTISCKSLPDLIYAFCRYETISVMVYTEPSVMWFDGTGSETLPSVIGFRVGNAIFPRKKCIFLPRGDANEEMTAAENRRYVCFTSQQTLSWHILVFMIQKCKISSSYLWS